MPDSELQNAYNALYKRLKNNKNVEQFKPFFKAVEDVNTAMSALHQRDNYGRIHLVGAREREQLMKLHETMGKEAEKLIASNLVPQKQMDALQKVAALGAANYRHLRAYDPKQPRTLPELLEDVRTRTLDLRFDKQAEKVGSAQNSRQLLSFLDDRGRQITGVFTQKKEVNFWSRWENHFTEEANRLSGEASDYVQGLMSALDTPRGAKALGLPDNATRADKMSALHMKLVLNKDEQEIYKFFSDLFSTKEYPMSPDQARGTFYSFAKPFKDFIVKENSTSLLNNHYMAKIPDGARLDNRNAAMSAVAELLNVPKLVAKAVPMKVTVWNEFGGEEEVEGTFMELAEGTVPDNVRAEDAAYGQHSLKDTDGRGLKDIADLQVLDFICGNTDRHAGNVAYQFDPKTKKFIGVQGYDNDTAFGLVMPLNDGTHQAFLTKPENMLYMSQSMYETLQTITPEMLKFSLRGFGLSEAELDAAAKRMDIVKQKVEKDLEFFRKQGNQKGKEAKKPDKDASQRLRVLRDQDFKKLKMEDLERKTEYEFLQKGEMAKKTGSANFFTRALHKIKQFPKLVKENHQKYRDFKSRVPLGVQNRANPGTVFHELRDVKELEDELGRRTKGNRTSPEYEAIEKAVSDYREYEEELKTRLWNAQEALEKANKGQTLTPEETESAYDGLIHPEDLDQMRRLGQAIRDTARAYLIGKGVIPATKGGKAPHNDNDYKEYTQDRIEIARTAMKFGEARSKIDEEETELSFRNERRLTEATNRQIGDLREKEDQMEQQKGVQIGG